MLMNYKKHNEFSAEEVFLWSKNCWNKRAKCEIKKSHFINEKKTTYFFLGRNYLTVRTDDVIYKSKHLVKYNVKEKKNVSITTNVGDEYVMSMSDSFLSFIALSGGWLAFSRQDV